MKIQKLVMPLFIVGSLAISGCGNSVEREKMSIKKNWCSSQNGKIIKYEDTSISEPMHCKIPILKGKANIITGYSKVYFTSLVSNYDTGEREIIASIPNQEKSKILAQSKSIPDFEYQALMNKKLPGAKSSSWVGVSGMVYDDVVIGTYINANAPEFDY